MIILIVLGIVGALAGSALNEYREMPVWKKTVIRTKLKKVCWVSFSFLLLSNIVGRLTVVKNQKSSKTQRLASGLTYHRDMWKRSRVHTVEVNLTKAQPVMLSAKHLSYGKRSLTGLVVDRNATDPKPIMVAVNGDFFDEGGNQGFAKSGNLQTAPNPERASVEFRRRGTWSTVQLYRFGMQACVKVGNEKFPVRSTFNNHYRVGDIGVYTSARVVSAVGSCDNLVMAKVKLTKERDSQFAGVISQVVENPTENLQANDGEIVLVAGNENEVPTWLGAYAFAKRNFHKDVFVEVFLPVFPKPGEIALSGGPEIMRMGHYFVMEEANDRLCSSTTAHTAVGISIDHHHLLVVAVEGPPKWGATGLRELWRLFRKVQLRAFFKAIVANERLSLRALGQKVILPFLGWGIVSHGMNMQDLYQYMVEHNSGNQPIYEALNLDGGSSTTMVVGAPPEVTNYLMEGRQAQIANGLGFAPR